MEQDQPRVEHHPSRHGDDHHPTLSETFDVVTRQNHRRDLQPGSGAHQNTRELVGSPRSLLIHSGISIMYMVLQVHISVEAINNMRTFYPASRSRVMGLSVTCSTRATDGSAKGYQRGLMTKIPAAMENMVVKP